MTSNGAPPLGLLGGGRAEQAPSPLRRWLSHGLLIALFFFGYVHWLLFFNLGAETTFSTLYDWGKEFRYYHALQDALRQGVMPYHMAKVEHHTDRVLAIPEVILSPQVLLLKYVEIPTFIVVNTLLAYSLGFLGLVLLRNRYRLSLFSFAVFYVLFNFNGFIVAHLGAAHAIWTGYFLFPWFMLLVLRMLEEPEARSLWMPLSLVLFLMALQGFFHGYNWCVLLLILLAVFQAKLRWTVAWTVVASFLLCACRFWPAMMTLGKVEHPYITGFPGVIEWLSGMVVPHYHDEIGMGGYFGKLGWTEFDFYVGGVGLAFLFYFGIYRRIKPEPELLAWRYPPLDVPLALMTVLSFDYFLAVTRFAPIPFAGTERITTRFFILPLLFCAFLATVRMEHAWWRKPISRTARCFLWAALFQTTTTLLDHSLAWRSYKLMDTIVAEQGMDTTNRLVLRPDPYYKAVVWISLAVSAIALAVVLILWARSGWKGKRRGEPLPTTG